MSSAVIGSPLTKAATWACAAFAPQDSTSATAAAATIRSADGSTRRFRPITSFTAEGMVSSLFARAPRFFASKRSEQSEPTDAARGGTLQVGPLAEARPADRTQVDHQQHPVVGRGGAAVVIIRDVV